MATCTVRFCVKFDNALVPIRELQDRIDDLLHYYLWQPRLSCCTMQAGFLIEAGTVTYEAVDEFLIAETWLPALVAVVTGAQQEAFVWAWEESKCHIRRRGAFLEIEDIHHSGVVACPRIVVDLKEFAQQVLDEAKSWATVADHAIQALATESYHHYSEEKKGTIARNVAPPGLQEGVSELEAALKAWSPAA